MDKNLIHALLLLLLILIIASVAWYYVYRMHTVLVDQLHDGGSVYVKSGRSKVVSAVYHLGCETHDVKEKLQAQLAAITGNTFTLSASSLGMTPGGYLTFRYKCTGGSKDKFSIEIDSDNSMGIELEAAWDSNDHMIPRYVNKMPMMLGAVSPENGAMPNPYLGVGKTNMVRALADPYRNDNFMRDGLFNLNNPVYDESVNDSAMSMLQRVSSRNGSGCLYSGPDCDSSFITDGPYGEDVIASALTSTGCPPDKMTGIRYGLGSVRIDPRFQPGARCGPVRDYNSAPGTHAGSANSYGFAPSTFQTSGSWHSTPNNGNYGRNFMTLKSQI